MFEKAFFETQTQPHVREVRGNGTGKFRSTNREVQSVFRSFFIMFPFLLNNGKEAVTTNTFKEESNAYSE